MIDRQRAYTTTLDRRRTALLLVDLQYTLLNTVAEPEQLLRNVHLLLRAAQVLEIPVILTTQYAQGLGNIHREVLRVYDGGVVFDKKTFSCFLDARFESLLRQQAPNATNLIVAGVEAHICVAQTVLGAIDRGLTVHVPVDAIASRNAVNLNIGISRMEGAGAIISSAEAVVYELLGQAGTPQFKALHPLLK